MSVLSLVLSTFPILGHAFGCGFLGPLLMAAGSIVGGLLAKKGADSSAIMPNQAGFQLGGPAGFAPGMAGGPSGYDFAGEIDRAQAQPLGSEPFLAGGRQDIDMLRESAMGRGPSTVLPTLQMNREQAIQQALALAQSNPYGRQAQPLATRTAMAGAGAANADLARNAYLAKVQEAQNARMLLPGAEAQFGALGLNTDVARNQIVQDILAKQLERERTGLGASMNYEQLAQQARMGAQERGDRILGGALQGAGSIAASFLAGGGKK